MKLEDLDGSVFLFNPQNIKSLKELKSRYSEFNINYKDLEEQTYHKLQVDQYKVIKYTILFYDMNSPLRVYFPDFNKRKVEAALMAGFEVKDKHFRDDVTDMLVGKITEVNDMYIRYMMLFSNPDYIALMNAWQLYVNESKKILDKKSKSDKTYIQGLQLLNAEIKEKTHSVFGGDETKEIKENLYKYLDLGGLDLRPENIAKKKKLGENIVDIDLYA